MVMSLPTRAPSPLKPLSLGLMLACGAALLMAGCSHAPTQNAQLRIKPVYGVTDGGQVDRSYGHIARARELEQDNQLAAALAWWRKAVEAAPQRADAHQGLGLCLARMGQLDEGVAALRTAQQLRPHDPVILNNLGFALKLVGQSQEAEARQLFERALSLDPAYDRARYNLAQLTAPGMSLRLTPAEPGTALAVAVPAAAAETALQTAPPVLAQDTARSRGLVVVQSTPNVPRLALQTAPQALPSMPVEVALAGKPVPDKLVPPIQPPGLQAAGSQVADAPLSLTPAVTLSGVAVEVFNGNGVAGAARHLKRTLAQQGVTAQRVANLPGFNTPVTRVVYAPGHAAEARKLARLLKVSSELAQATPEEARGMRAELRVVLGRNFRPAHMAGADIGDVAAGHSAATEVTLASLNAAPPSSAATL